VTDLEGAAIVNDAILAFTVLFYKCRVSAGDSLLMFNAASVRLPPTNLSESLFSSSYTYNYVPPGIS